MAPHFVVQEISECNIPKKRTRIRKKLAEKQSREQKRYWVIWRQRRFFCACLWLNGIWNMAWVLQRFINWWNINQVNLFMASRGGGKRQVWGRQKSLKKQLGNVAKLKGNIFYGKMIEDLSRHKSTKTYTWWKDCWRCLRSPFCYDLEEICGAYEIKKIKRNSMINRPYQCGILVYQLAKLRMLEFYNGFFDKYFSRHYFELCYMDTDLFYILLSGDWLDEIVKLEIRQAYEADKKNWLVTDKFSKTAPGIFKSEFISIRGVWLTAKCYLVQNKIGKNKYSSVKVFQRSIMICILSNIKVSWMFSKMQD